MIEILEHKFPMFVDSVPNHLEIKEKVLEQINVCPNTDIKTDCELISKTDWLIASDIHRPYMDVVGNIFEKYLNKLSEVIKYHNPPNLSLDNYWFQQYEIGDYHGPHRHHSCFSCIYYVELPTGSSLTTFHLFGKEFSVPVKEGQILSFPGAFEHESKPNQSGRKTVIAFNAR